MKAGICQSHCSELCRIVVILDALKRTYLVGIEKLAWHFALKLNVRTGRRKDELSAYKSALRIIFLCRRSDQISVLGVWEIQFSTTAGIQKVNSALNSLGVICHTVTFRAEHPYVHLSHQGRLLKNSLRSAA